MSSEQYQFIQYLALLAAFAEQENGALKRVNICLWSELLGGSTLAELVNLHHDLPGNQPDRRAVDRYLTNPLYRLLAYEMVVSICHFEGHPGAPGRRFLASLARTLELNAKVREPFHQQVEVPAKIVEALVPQLASDAGKTEDQSAMQHFVRECSILCGALEMHRESWASMSIYPLQIRMVEEIARRNACAQDSSQVRQWLASLGLGLTPRFIEHLSDKLLGAILGSLGTCPPCAFADTHALGQVTVRHFATERQASDDDLKGEFEKLRGAALQQQIHHLPAIRQQAARLNLKLE